MNPSSEPATCFTFIASLRCPAVGGLNLPNANTAVCEFISTMSLKLFM